jgi:hypothetical protein
MTHGWFVQRPSLRTKKASVIVGSETRLKDRGFPLTVGLIFQRAGEGAVVQYIGDTPHGAPAGRG